MILAKREGWLGRGVFGSNATARYNCRDIFSFQQVGWEWSFPSLRRQLKYGRPEIGKETRPDLLSSEGGG